MADQEVVLRPGDTVSLRIEVPGRPMRLDLKLTPDGVNITEPRELPQAGAPTLFGGVAPGAVASEAPLDITAELDAEDKPGTRRGSAPDVESLAAVEPFDVGFASQDVTFEEVDEAGDPVAEVTDHEDDDLDISFDDESQREPAFQADAVTMVPPAGDAVLTNPKKKFQPNEDDTLPVWTGKARTYRDPALEQKKHETGGHAGAPQEIASPGASVSSPAGRPIAKAPGAPSTGGGSFTVFLSPPKGAEKRQVAAQIIADIRGIDLNAAMEQAGKMIVPVVKNVDEDAAQSVRERFKQAGLSCRITQKR